MTPRDKSELFRLVYRSRASFVTGEEDGQGVIDAILTTSRRRNAQAGVTGILLYAQPYFVQALEGPATAVEAAFDRICCDLRHDTIEVVECGPVLEPAFGDWSMDYVSSAPGADAVIDRIADGADLAEVAATTMCLLSALIRSRPMAEKPRKQLAST